MAPPLKRPLLVSNGLMAKACVRRARRTGLLPELQSLAGERARQR